MFDYSIFRNDWEAKNFSYLERYFMQFSRKRENALSKSVQARADSLPKINEGNSHTRRN